MAVLVFIIFSILCNLPPPTSYASHDMVIDVNDDDVKSEKDLFALYHKWVAIHRPNENSFEYSGHDDSRDNMLLKRFQIFKDNVRYIHAKNKWSNITYTLGLNKFADLSNDEFQAVYTRPKVIQQKSRGQKENFMYENVTEVMPASVDWREKGAVTGVKDQGACGSCWAFSTIVAVEGVNKIQSGELVSLSEQELIDCDKKMNEGCNGGLMDYAFQFIVDNGGINSESNYPYTASDNQCNLAKRNSHAVVIDGYEDVPANSDDALMKAVSHQPVSVAIDAGGLDFQFYWKGVFGGTCGTELDHGVAVVGYGETSKGIKYWIVKNSWGSDWGEEGYLRMRRGEMGKKEGLCGINMMASYPIKSSPNPSPSKTNDPLIRQPFGRKSGQSITS